MLDELRDRISQFISQNRYCVISAMGSTGEWAIPAEYESHGLEITCHLPRWSDVLFYIEQEPSVNVIIQDLQADHLRWIQVRGSARRGESTQESYSILVQVEPERIDLLNEACGWIERETLDC